MLASETYALCISFALLYIFDDSKYVDPTELAFDGSPDKSSNQHSMHEFLAIHTYDVESGVQPNEAILNSLRKMGSRARFFGSHNSAVFGAMTPGSSSSKLLLASCIRN